MLNLDKNKNYLLACSFGPDSMALFYMLLKEGFRFSVAHVNYHLREESNNETKGLIDYCEKNNIQFYICDVKEEIINNIEERCREIRYQFFHDVFEKEQKFDALLVAHHQDDLLETYLLQKQRKILPHHYGLSENTTLFGIPVIRPLLGYKKANLLELCTTFFIPHAFDSSNFLDIFARNKIRHEVVEKMTENERKEMLKKIEKDNSILESAYKKIGSLDELSNRQILELEPIVYRLYLNRLAKEIQPDFEVSSNIANEIKKVLLSDKPNVQMKVSKNLDFVKEYETCYFDFPNSQFDYQYLLERPAQLDTPYFYLDFTNGASNRNITDDEYPLTIRNAQLEDVAFIKDYPVKVRRLFIDWKMPTSLRKRWPVILNKDNRIIYIPRYQKDFVPNEQSNFYVKKRFSLKKR